MNEIVYKEARDFLDPIYNNALLLNDRPFITLTFAQSLDGKIAKQGQQILISGKESMAMTHRLRILHDGILVGIGTALVDDPQLNGKVINLFDLSNVFTHLFISSLFVSIRNYNQTATTNCIGSIIEIIIKL